MKGVDYSAGTPGGAALRQAGYGFAIRYIGTPGRRKNLTATEYRDLREHGIAVGLVYEDAAGTALQGASRGAADARAVLADAQRISVPVRMCYFAVDFDVTSAGQMTAIDAYLRGAASVLGPARIGVYGEADVIDHCLASGSARYGWQTRAWSRGRVSTRAHVLQELSQPTVGGVACDLNLARATDFGQTPAPGGAQEEEDMPLNDADKRWIAQTVKSAVDERIRRLVPRALSVAFSGHSNLEFGRDGDPNMDAAGWSTMSAAGQLQAQVAAIATAVGEMLGTSPDAVEKTVRKVLDGMAVTISTEPDAG